GDERVVADLDGVGAPGDLDDGGRDALAVVAVAAEVGGEPGGVDGRGGDDDLEVRAAGQQPGEVAEDEVDVEGPLVRLVDDDRVVAPQHRVALDLREEDAVGHELDEGRGTDLVGEAHLVADGAAELDVELLGDAL